MTKSLDELERKLELAVDNAAHWEDVCNEILNIFGATGVILAPATPTFRGVWMSCSTRLATTLPEYIEGGWHLNDPREKVTSLMIERGYATDDQIYESRTEKAAEPFYQGFLRRHDFGNLLAIRLLTPSGYFGAMVHFANDYPAFSKSDFDKIEPVTKLLEDAISRAEILAYQRIQDFTEFFKGAKSEVFVFDGQGEGNIRLTDDSTHNPENNLSSLLPIGMNETLEEEIAALLESDVSLSLSKAFQFNVDDKTYNMLIIQAPPRMRHFFMPFKVAAIRTESSDLSALKHNKLSNDFSFTNSEITTVKLLAFGNTPGAIAEILSLKTTTIRQRLKTMYNKAAVNSQVELVAFFNNL